VKDEALFLSNLPVIDDVIGQICRRHRLTASEAEDFTSEVRLLFIERNYEPLRRFEGRSSLRTYLIVVIQRLFLDYRNRLWGRWRPSAEAKRLGPLAILVERLVTRDGLTLDQVAQTLRVNHDVNLDETLSALCVKLSLRPPSPQIVPEAAANGVESSAPSPEANVLRAEQGFLARRVQTALERARQGLVTEDRIILKMRFEDAVPVADIARALHLNQKRLYRTIARLLDRIRASLEREHISWEDVSALFAEGGLGADSFQGAHDGAGSGRTPERAEGARTAWWKGR
jgi:RNA polymerase sigma factor (sigma-70 family)